MYEQGLTARKIAEFDSAIFDEYRAWESQWNWNNEPDRYLRVDGTYMIYLPTHPMRNTKDSFGVLTYHYTNEIDILWENILKSKFESISNILGIDDPVIVQADIAIMPPGGDTVMHNDTRINQRYARRYNIAISTNDDCWLYHNSYDLENGGTRDHISEGEVWELNNKITHTAVNYGKTWRTHFILDVMPRNYAERMFQLYNPYAKVPNPLGKNTTYDLNNDGTLIHAPLFNDLPHCFSARTQL